jgi:16S rRNA G966 N2-methylase RsmD
LLRENLAALEIKSEARVIAASVSAAIAKLQADSANFDFVYLDPPYANENEYDATLRTLEKSSLVSESTIVIAEHRKSFELPALLGRFERLRILRQGDAALTFYRQSAFKNNS